MSLSQRDVVVDPALSNVSIKYTNTSFIADQILPIIKVGKQTGKYYIYDKSNLRVDKTLRAAASPSNEVEFGLSLSGVFYCDDHALKGKVADEIQDQAEQALNPMIDETESITEKLLLDREVAAATLLRSTTNLTQNTTLSGTAQWNDYTNSNPLGDIRTAKNAIHAATFKIPNTLVLPRPVFNTLIDHPSIVGRVQYSQLGIVTQELLARVFQVDTVLVADAGYNTAAEGQTDALSYAWGKDVILAYVEKQPKLKMLSLGATFTYSLRQVMKWRDEDRKVTYVRVGEDYYVQKIIAAVCGYLIKTAIA